MIKNKKAQEELIGFGLIIMVVAIIGVVFLSLSLKGGQKENVESYEVDSFIQAFLQYHTTCQEYSHELTLKELIFACNIGNLCSDGSDTCDMLGSTLENIADESWETGEYSPVKAYELKIHVNGEDLISIEKGETTNNYKGSSQNFVKSGDNIDIIFTAYY